MVKVENDENHPINVASSYETQTQSNFPSPEYQRKVEQFQKLAKELGLAYAIENGFLVSINVRRKGKKLYLEARRISENEIDAFIKQTQDVHNRKHVVITATLSCIGSAVVALAPQFNLGITQKGAEALNTFWAGTKGGIDAMEKKLSDNDSGELTGLQHLTESKRSHKSDIQQSTQEAEKAIQEMEEKNQRVAQKANEMMMRIY